jgi:hypothetical protein
MPARLVRKQAEKVKSISMVRLDLQNLSVESLGFP